MIDSNKAYPPIIHKVVLGHRVYLDTNSSIPSHWYHEADRPKYSSNLVVIPRIQPDTAGVYLCLSQNGGIYTLVRTELILLGNIC